jgi:signal transduction histidine kinase
MGEGMQLRNQTRNRAPKAADALLGMAHDLGSLGISAELSGELLKEATKGPSGSVAPTVLAARAERLGRVGRLLGSFAREFVSLSRSGVLEPTLQTRVFSLAELVAPLEDAFDGKASVKGLRLGFRVPQHGVLEGDLAKVQRILANLIDNAIRYTDSGGVRVTVRWEKGRLRAEVADTGPGMGGAAPSAQGFGLGLKVVQRLVGLLGGELDIIY